MKLMNPGLNKGAVWHTLPGKLVASIDFQGALIKIQPEISQRYFQSALRGIAVTNIIRILARAGTGGTRTSTGQRKRGHRKK